MKTKETLPEEPVKVRYNRESKFIEYNLATFEGVKKYKSVARAIRKGYVTDRGYVAPRRPFNNRKDHSRSGRTFNTIKRGIYAELTKRF